MRLNRIHISTISNFADMGFFEYICMDNQWGPYPFIFLNLVGSLMASYTAPVIIMSQNRQYAKIILEAHTDYLINLKAEEEIRAILDNLNAQKTLFK